MALRYFRPASAWEMMLRLEPADGSEETVQTSDDRRRTYTRHATIASEIGGTSARLVLYSTPGHDNGLFLPFRDATSGKTTYGAGRYLDVASPVNGEAVVDFKCADDPYCAYNDAFSCLLPPVENWLDVPIEADERHDYGI